MGLTSGRNMVRRRARCQSSRTSRAIDGSLRYPRRILRVTHRDAPVSSAPFLMSPHRLFIPQEALDLWLSEGRAAIDGEHLTLTEGGQRFHLQTGVRFRSEVAGGGDAHDLVGRVKDLAQIQALGGDYSAGSVVLDPDAYEVVEGFVGTPIEGAQRVADPGATGGGDDVALLARMFLGSR